jgi:hypothetical protein
MNNPFGLGAHESPLDERTWQHSATTVAPLVIGGIHYAPQEIENQHTVGICTGISLIQNAEKALSKKFSPDFQYLLQKKYIDGNWDEGSSIFSALKVGKNYGFLPLSLFTYVTESDRSLPYSEYIAKLQAIPDSEIQRLIGLCTDKLTGYAQVQIDAPSLAIAINDSISGVLTRYTVGDEWWTAKNGQSSWQASDIDPLRPPQVPISGHAINTNAFDFTVNQMLEHANTWGIEWDMQGVAHTNHAVYQCTEAWIPYYQPLIIVPPKKLGYQFTTNFGYFSLRFLDVYNLQKTLVAQGFATFKPTGFFGTLTLEAVKAFQVAHSIEPTGFVGPLSRAVLNST